MRSAPAASVHRIGDGTAVQAEGDQREQPEQPDEPDENDEPVSAYTWIAIATVVICWPSWETVTPNHSRGSPPSGAADGCR
jgi:hypothetical protein